MASAQLHQQSISSVVNFTSSAFPDMNTIPLIGIANPGFTMPAAVATLLAIYLVWHFATYGNNGEGPFIWPFIGTFFSRLIHLKDALDHQTKLLMKDPDQTFMSVSPGIKVIITANPANVEHILKTNFNNYPKGPYFQDNQRDLLGHGIFNSDEDTWRTQRKTASYEFSARSLRDLMVASIRGAIHERLLPIFQKSLDSGKPLDVQDVLLRYTFEGICRIGFGVDPGCLAIDLPTVPFAKAFDDATQAINMRFILAPTIWKLCKWLHIGPERKLRKAVKVVNEFADSVIKQRRQELQQRRARQVAGQAAQETGPESTFVHSDLLSRFMMMDEQNKGQLYSDTFLRDACTNFILAGRDTSSVALSWFFWLLTWHPDVEEKILEVVNHVFDAREGDAGMESPLDESTLTYEELKKLEYLHAAITESLRLYPSVAVDFKFCASDDVLPTGDVVRKNWNVIYSIYSMGRMESIWGPDAMEFKPERWIASDGTFRPESPFKFPAFNAGPRLCLGKEMAYLQMKSVAASILRKYRLTLVPGHRVEYKLNLTLFLKYGLMMHVHPR